MSQNIPAPQAQAPVQYTAANDPVTALAERYGMLPQELDSTLRSTVFKAARNNEEFLALCFVAKQYQLNPLLREIYAFPQKESGGIVPLVGVDGYVSMMHRQPAFDGLEFRYAEKLIAMEQNGRPAPEWVECIIYRKDQSRPTIVREYLDECFRSTPAWRSHPRRMLRHKALCQGARLAFGFSGVYADAEDVEPVQATVHEDRPVDVNAAIDAAVEAQPKPAPKAKGKPAFKLQQRQEAPAPAPAPAPEPEPVQAEPVQEQDPAVPDSRASADIDEAYFDYCEANGIDLTRADGVCRQLVSGGACKTMTEARKIFVEKQYTCSQP